VNSYKGRKLNLHERVEVYRNLNMSGAGAWYSVRQGGYVVGHTCDITLMDAKFVVRKGGRDRVLKTGRKNVHAWVSGLVCPRAYDEEGQGVKVMYRPQTGDSFYTHYAGDITVSLRTAFLVSLRIDGVTAWRVNES